MFLLLRRSRNSPQQTPGLLIFSLWVKADERIFDFSFDELLNFCVTWFRSPDISLSSRFLTSAEIKSADEFNVLIAEQYAGCWLEPTAKRKKYTSDPNCPLTATAMRATSPQTPSDKPQPVIL